jgi:hypothetical protein
MAKPKRIKSQTEREAERLIARARDLEAVNVHPDAAVLPLQQDIEVTRAGQQRQGQKVRTDSARRLDAFAALKDGMAPGAYDAARRLERDILIRMNLSERPASLERVDGSKGHADAMILAGGRVLAIAARIPPRDYWLLVELIAPPIDRGSWRDHVAYITGETHVHAQGAVVRSACLNLRDAYAAVERRAA